MRDKAYYGVVGAMRMWLIDPKRMCRRHLLGEHVEIHMLKGVLDKNKSIQGFLDGGLVDPSLAYQRHKEIIAEMKRRGYNHKSDLDFKSDIKGSINTKNNIRDLKKRCKECYLSDLGRD